MSGEPKTHTPQEALRLLRERGMELTFDSNDATPWAVYRDNGEYLNEYLHFGQSEEEVLSAALGVRVVARDEVAELRAALRTLVTDLEDLMEESHVQLYDGNGALVDTSWGKLLQGGKDEYLSNWNEAKRLSLCKA